MPDAVLEDGQTLCSDGGVKPHIAGSIPAEHLIVKQGWLLKQSRYIQDWRRRWIVLTETNLMSFKNPAATTSTELLPLSECNTVKTAEGVGHKHAFRVDTPERVFFLVASSAADKESWIGAIGKHMIYSSNKALYTEEDVVY